MPRLIHHLITPRFKEEPIACAPDYETAAEFVNDEMDGRASISLLIRSGKVGPCPVCEFGKPKRNGVVNH